MERQVSSPSEWPNKSGGSSAGVGVREDILYNW